MSPQLWILACVSIFVVSFVGQLVRGNRRPWLLPFVAAGGFAFCALVLTHFALPRIQEAITESMQRASEPSR